MPHGTQAHTQRGNSLHDIIGSDRCCFSHVPLPRKGTRKMKAKANLFRTLVVLPVGLLVAVAVALFGVGLRTAETQTTAPKMQVQDLGTLEGSSSVAMGIS